MSSLSLPTTLRLPHPYLTTYRVRETSDPQSTSRDGAKLLRIYHEPRTSGLKDAQHPPEQLHSDVLFSNPAQEHKDDLLPPESNNFFWARIRRSPKSNFVWNKSKAPTIGQAWLIAYALFTLRPELEFFRLELVGAGSQQLAQELKVAHLAIQHPVPEGSSSTHPEAYANELVLLRSTFWQGAGSPFGARPVWTPDVNHICGNGSSSYPLYPLDFTITTKFPESRVHAFHPRRPQKPAPGSMIYSRYIPHLDEHLSMYALDYTNEEHLQLFHTWQNDPFVAAGWNETGTLEQHRRYLKNLHDDPHVFTILAKFDDTFFAYYEFYWGKEDHFGVYCDAGDFDRGRHSLVGDSRYRGKHRVSAWWSSQVHYLFLDDPRTQMVIGEPKYTNPTVLSYDLLVGLNVTKHVDLTHKRSAAMKVNRERFFQLCPLHYDGGLNVGGTGVKLFGKL